MSSPHNFTGWTLDAIAARRLPDRVRSCKSCGKIEREGVDGYRGHVPAAQHPAHNEGEWAE